jgi:hypothetical protein
MVEAFHVPFQAEAYRPYRVVVAGVEASFQVPQLHEWVQHLAPLVAFPPVAASLGLPPSDRHGLYPFHVLRLLMPCLSLMEVVALQQPSSLHFLPESEPIPNFSFLFFLPIVPIHPFVGYGILLLRTEPDLNVCQRQERYQ